MKFFLDTANLDEIKEINELGILDGVTTNPSLMAREGKTNSQVLEQLCKYLPLNCPISAEVLSMEYNTMIQEATQLASIGSQINIKLPINQVGLKVGKYCQKNKIRTNLTLVFSSMQALLASRIGATYVSPFVGRLDDISQDGLLLLRDIRQIFDVHYIETEIIAASIRNPVHVIEAAKCGVDIVTVPYKLLLQLIYHPLTNAGIKKFQEDYDNALGEKNSQTSYQLKESLMKKGGINSGPPKNVKRPLPPPPYLLRIHPYGYCPICFKPGISRERRLNGDDKCDGGHVYPSKDAQITRTIKED